MRWMLLVLVLAHIVLATTLFAMRQRRLELGHDITLLHRQMNQCRIELWDHQVRIAGLAKPTNLQRAILSIGLRLEPAVSADRQPLVLGAVQSHNGE